MKHTVSCEEIVEALGISLDKFEVWKNENKPFIASAEYSSSRPIALRISLSSQVIRTKGRGISSRHLERTTFDMME